MFKSPARATIHLCAGGACTMPCATLYPVRDKRPQPHPCPCPCPCSSLAPCRSRGWSSSSCSCCPCLVPFIKSASLQKPTAPTSCFKKEHSAAAQILYCFPTWDLLRLFTRATSYRYNLVALPCSSSFQSLFVFYHHTCPRHLHLIYPGSSKDQVSSILIVRTRDYYHY